MNQRVSNVEFVGHPLQSLVCRLHGIQPSSRGLEMHLNQQTKLGLSFSSQFGNNVQDNAVQGNLTWRF